MKKLDVEKIIQKIDQLNLDYINTQERELLKQLNQTVFTISNKLLFNEYDQEIIDQFSNLLDIINEALDNNKNYNINILLFAVQNSLKLLYTFDSARALIIWNKFFINDLTMNNEPEFILNEHKIL